MELETKSEPCCYLLGNLKREGTATLSELGNHHAFPRSGKPKPLLPPRVVAKSLCVPGTVNSTVKETDEAPEPERRQPINASQT